MAGKMGEPRDTGCVQPDVVAWFSDWARREPARLALSGDYDLTYGELDRRSAALAGRIRASASRESDVPVVVPLFLERSTSLVVAMLATLRAGFAYTVLEPSMPSARLDYIIRDVAAEFVVTCEEFASRLPTGAPGTVYVMDTKDPPASLPEPEPTSLAYVLYTSGSTGNPKGVMVERRSLTNYVGWQRRALGITADDRASQLASLAFDGSICELWPYLAAGASVHFADDCLRREPTALARWMTGRGITMMFAPTPLAEMLLDEPTLAGGKLRSLLTGGDVLRRRPPVSAPYALVNLYGPTETTCASTCALVPPGDTAGPVSAGAPIDNTFVYILDENQHPVRPGEVGEVYIGGLGVARGYLGLPELTEKFFLPDPWSDTARARMYRTGDLARLQVDGTVVVVGRQDSQVQVRGFRVELGEVEAAALRHPEVTQAAARLWSAESQTLAVYVVGRAAARIETAEVRDTIARYLPEYAVPSYVVLLPELPVNDRGKLDLEQLPRPTGDSADIRRGALGQNQEESILRHVWEEMLGVPVRDDDDFFDLGGHSLLAMRITLRLRHDHGIEIRVAHILENPTVAQLARSIRPEHRARPG